MERNLTKYVGAYVGFVLVMNMVDGPWRRWSKGDVVDVWTSMHVIWGFAADKMGLSFKTLLWLSLLNEGSEALMRKYRPDLTWGTPESPLNITVDLISTQAGWLISDATSR